MATPSPNPALMTVLPPVDDMPPAPLTALRIRIGLPDDDTSRDDELTAAWQTAVEWAESYLNRYLRNGDYVEHFTHLDGKAISLGGYPLVSIDSITDAESGAAISGYHIESDTGLLHLDGWRFHHLISVAYTAIYPKATGIGLALLSLFDAVWMTLSAKTTSATAGTVKSRAIDGMRVEYETGTGGSVSSFGSSDTDGLPDAAAFLLQPFRRMNA